MRVSIVPRVLAAILFFGLVAPSNAKDAVSFKAADGVTIHGDYYAGRDSGDPLILAFHQASSGRAEYNDIAPLLVDQGFAVLAIDQRSGGTYNGQENETAKGAAGTYWVHADALPDLEAALLWARQKQPAGKILVWGSSYSAALAIVLAGEHPEISGVLSFSPAEYFDGKPSVREAAAKVRVPVFITSSNREAPATRQIFEATASADKTQFVPEGAGFHGSRTLLPKTKATEEYWKAIDAFLAKFR